MAARLRARNGVEHRRGGALTGRSIPDETTTVDNGGVTSTKLDDAMDCSRRIGPLAIAKAVSRPEPEFAGLLP
ncbi:hypothetical protein Scep_002643 [Stephania cephalantha]|uniref:Uncharacterized protein n=1 Tax=Stephania cephalantha TaxID=152367 RepID=A0AAP0Q4H5_9MAGN